MDAAQIVDEMAASFGAFFPVLRRPRCGAGVVICARPPRVVSLFAPVPALRVSFKIRFVFPRRVSVWPGAAAGASGRAAGRRALPRCVLPRAPRGLPLPCCGGGSCAAGLSGAAVRGRLRAPWRPRPCICAVAPALRPFWLCCPRFLGLGARRGAVAAFGARLGRGSPSRISARPRASSLTAFSRSARRVSSRFLRAPWRVAPVGAAPPSGAWGGGLVSCGAGAGCAALWGRRSRLLAPLVLSPRLLSCVGRWARPVGCGGLWPRGEQGCDTRVVHSLSPSGYRRGTNFQPSSGKSMPCNSRRRSLCTRSRM